MSAWGLRGRLLVAFILLGVTTTVAVSGTSYVVARDVVLAKAQDSAVTELTAQIATLYPRLTLPPTQVDLEAWAGVLSDRVDTAVVVHGGRASGNSLVLDTIPAELREKVRTGYVGWQRVSQNGVPALVIGTRLGVEPANGQPRLSDVEVYSVRSLLPEQESIDRLATNAWRYGALSVAFAVLLALVAARGVLRPVRELGAAAHRLGHGDLAARVEISGSDELADVARTFNTTAESLEAHVGELRRMESDARRFVADVSHELRTPLAAMTAVADVLDEEAPNLVGDAATAARLVSQETHNLTRLVNDLVEVSRFDSGTAALALDEVDVADTIRATLRARGWSDAVEADLPTGIVTRLDPRRLDVVVANLVGNALRHGATPVTVALSARPDELTVEVADHGPGLRPAVLPHVFDRFYKADTARSRSEGSGLGLAIAWENARLHGGVLVAANRPEGGAVFTLRLPRQLEVEG